MNRSTRREFLKQTGALSAGAFLGGRSARSAATTGSANVVVLKSDEHNPFFSSIGRFSHVETPNMKRLAERGVIFQNTYCPSPLCSPSRSAFCAGKRVHQIQSYSNCQIFKHEHPCYGRMLAENGVHSVHVGKADFYNLTSTLGFSEAILPGDRDRCDVNIARDPLAIREDGAGRSTGYGPREDPFRGDIRKMDAALDWIKSESGSVGKPWTMEINLAKPHFPHHVTPDLWSSYANWNDLPQYGRSEESANHPRALDLRAHFQTDLFTEEHTRGLRQGYYGCITFIDSQLGRLLDALDESGLSENTVVAYTSDHGEMLGKFGMWWKCSLYEDSVRVPLVIAGPGFEEGRTSETPVDLLDLQATFFRTSGRDVARPSDWVGKPLQDLQNDDPSRVVFSEYHGHGARASSYLIRKGDWKLLYCCEAPHQLFDLKNDPDELENQFGKQPQKAAELEAELRKICDPDAENQRAGGYIKKQLAAIQEDGTG